MNGFIYRGQNTQEISFPLGGIGTGCIGLSGNGRLAEWEIFNKPNKGGVNSYSHFSIKVEDEEGAVLDTRVLNGDLPLTSYQGGNGGFGPARTTLGGMPHFRETVFEGRYPIANLQFIDDSFPGSVTMTAFNPLIPLNDADSSIPAAFFEITAKNILDRPVAFTIALSAGNPAKDVPAANTYESAGGISSIVLSSSREDTGDPLYGDLSIATDAAETSHQEYWYRGRWFDSLGCYWRDISAPGHLKNRAYTINLASQKASSRECDMATLAAHLKVAPGATGKVRFIISWNYPNCANYWDPEKCTCCGSDSGSGGGSGAVSSSGSGSDNSKSNGSCVTTRQLTWKNYYTKLFHNSKDSASYCLKNWDRLYAATAGFRDALFSSTLPEEVLDAVSANISILKTPTCLRIEDGSFYAFEGCNAGSGCCPGSCTHVWNYAYALPFLFPSLERSMRDLDYKYNMRDDGSMSFRLRLPPGRERSAFRACADGQFGGVIKVYRDWKISGDDNWLREKWDAVRKSIDFAWAPTNEDFWDEGRDGVLKGRQHHTLDMELFGPNSWLTGFYLAALKAGAEMAAYLGENEKAAEYRSLFCKGNEWADKNLFNGEYYTQNIDLKDRSTLDRYVSGATLHGTSAGEAYWNEEAGEIKYQIGEGCIIDQVLAQWHANLCGLGEIFNRENVKKALASIYKYNFKKSMRGFYNPCRLFSLNDEAGTVICDWPEGRYKPVTPVPYAEETMCGFEYQAAAHMIQEGMVAEGIKLVKAVRDRFDGYKRNPWNEYECGSNYGRSMASYALLNAFSGFMFDAAEGMIGFNPVADKANASDNAINVINSTSDIFFRCFWSLDGGYGVFEHDPSEGEVIITITGGQLKLGSVILPFLNGHRIISVSLAGTTICCFEFDNSGKFTFKPHIYIGKNNKLEIKYC